MPRGRAIVEARRGIKTPGAPALLQPRGLTFFLVVLAFAVYAFVPSGLLAHLLAMFGRAGIDRRPRFCSACVRPVPDAGAAWRVTFARDVHPLAVARFAVASLLAGFCCSPFSG